MMWGLAMGLVDQILQPTTIDGVWGNQKVGLDHVGFAGDSLEVMRAEWQRLGFAPTEPEDLRRVAHDGTTSSLGQRSCHIVLEQGYIELTEVAQPAPQHHLAPWLSRGPGLHILALGVGDLEAWRASLPSSVSAAVQLSPSMSATRRIAYGSRQGEAGFRWCMREARETPWALECIVQHLTPELVHQPAVQGHPNGARALKAVTLQCPEPAATREVHDALYGLAPGVLNHVAGRVACCSVLEVALADHAMGPRDIPLVSAPGCTLRLVAA